MATQTGEGPVFISYRNANSLQTAQYVATELRQRQLEVFVYVTAPGPGRFWEQIVEKIAGCRAFLLICAPGSFEAQEGEDWVAKECAEALAQQRRIIPVLIKDFVHPIQLAPSIANALEYAGVSIDTHYPSAAFDQLARLIQAAEETAPSQALEEAASSRARGASSAPRRRLVFIVAPAALIALLAIAWVTIPPDRTRTSESVAHGGAGGATPLLASAVAPSGGGGASPPPPDVIKETPLTVKQIVPAPAVQSGWKAQCKSIGYTSATKGGVTQDFASCQCIGKATTAKLLLQTRSKNGTVAKKATAGELLSAVHQQCAL